MGAVVKVGVGVTIVAVSVWATLVLLPPQSVPVAHLPEASIVEAVLVEMDAGRSDAGSDTVAAHPEPHPLTGALCPKGMNWVSGEYCPKRALLPDGCRVGARHLGVCMDAFEYPNQVGVVPAVMISYRQAESLCTGEGKRLCTDSEWTLACRTPEEPSACNHGHATAETRPARLWRRAEVAGELAAIDARRPSGVSACVSPSGVYDLPGNVQEWVTSERGGAYAAALKGGSYNQSSIDCERSVQTRLVNNGYPNTGFRCCAEPLVRLPVEP